MMTKQIPGRGAHWRLLAAIPACAAALLIFAFTDKPAEAAEQQAIQLTVTPAPEKEEIRFTFTPPPENKEIQLTVTPETPAAPAADDPMVIVDEPAVFPEAEGSFATWVMRQIRYPQAAQENGTQGRVNLRFVIERDGSVSNIEVMNSPERILSDEAIRVVRSSPKWTPARHKGELVRTWFALPIEFRLDSPAVPTTPVAPPAAPTDKPVAIDDIIAVGYGAIKREGNSMTLSVDPSAIGVITAVREELRSENTKQSESVIYVRNSDPGKEPKFIIDGIEADSETFQKLDPNQIKSITVLKDASSTAIYKGGEHGVVLVETKNSDATIHETNSFTDHYIIIDGKVATEKKFNRLKPEEIESIEVLKGDGSGKNGVLIVKTKR